MGIGEESHVGATEESCVGVGEESGMGAGQLSDDQYFLGNQCLPVDVVMSQTNQGWFGFKIVENKNVHPRHQSIDVHTRSLDYFHAFATFDCVNLSSFSENTPSHGS